MQSFLYEDMGSSLIDNYEFLVSKPTLQQVDDRTYGGPNHCTPIHEQSSCTGFLYEDKGSSLPGYYELLERNADLQQVEDVAYGGSHYGIPIHNQRLGIKVEGEPKCKRSFTEFVASFEAESSDNFAVAHGPQTNMHELEKCNATLRKVDDVENDGPDYYTANTRLRLVMKIEDENDWQRSFKERVA